MPDFSRDTSSVSKQVSEYIYTPTVDKKVNTVFQYWTELVFRHPHTTLLCAVFFTRLLAPICLSHTTERWCQKRFGKRDVKKAKPTRDINSAACQGIEQSIKKAIIGITPPQSALFRPSDASNQNHD